VCSRSLPAPALASLTGEVSQGRAIAAKVQAGTTSCSKLSDTDFEHLGDYVMDRMIGSRSAHQAMNDRMESMMGSVTADRMHQVLGRRYAGCPANGTTGMMGGGGMMGGAGMMGSNSSNWNSMMSSGNWSWMRNGNWQHMSRAQWQNTANTMMGGGWMMGGTSGGWSTAAVAGVVVLALLLVGLLVFAAVRRPRGHLPASPPAA
jgi:hypothetical protein